MKTWITDIVEMEEGNGIYIPKDWEKYVQENRKYEVVYENDTEKDRLLEEYFGGEENALICHTAIRMGDVGMSMLEPFPNIQEALKWIQEEKEKIYFVRQTNPELLRRFPEICVRTHPKEVEKAFGI